MTFRNFLLDSALLIVVLVVFNPALTGVPTHEWLGLGLGTLLLIHLLWHWEWIVNVGRRYFVRLFHLSRLKFLVDLCLFSTSALVALSGLLISRTLLPLLGIPTDHHSIWRTLHSVSADLSLVLLAIHLGLNWDWITCTLKRYLWTPIRQAISGASLGLGATAQACPQSVEGNLGRER